MNMNMVAVSDIVIPIVTTGIIGITTTLILNQIEFTADLKDINVAITEGAESTKNSLAELDEIVTSL